VRAIIAMAEAIGLDVVAEGVETRAQLDFIKEHGGCAVIQGWIFSPAVPAHEMEAILARGIMTPRSGPLTDSGSA